MGWVHGNFWIPHESPAKGSWFPTRFSTALQESRSRRELLPVYCATFALHSVVFLVPGLGLINGGMLSSLVAFSVPTSVPRPTVLELLC